MLLKINYTNGSYTWPPVKGAVTMSFCLYPFPSRDLSIVLSFSWGCLKCHYLCSHMLSKRLTKSPHIWPSVSLLPLLMQLHWPHPYAGCPSAFFCFILSLLLCCILLFSPAHCNVLSVHPLFCFSSQPCWREYLPLGNNFILPPENNNSLPKCFFYYTPWIWETGKSK